jgi:hypothetical protein
MMIDLTETAGRLTMHLEARRIGKDWNISVFGGDRPHIGAVALASPENPETPCQLLCLTNHREGDIAKSLASAMANHFSSAVCVSCGIHLDNITRDEIQMVYIIVEKFISSLQANTEK